MKKDTSHCVIASLTNELLCKHCMNKESLQLPIGVRDLVSHIGKFLELHKDCIPQNNQPTNHQRGS